MDDPLAKFFSYTTIDRVTATQVIIGNRRWRIKDGHEISGQYGSRCYAGTEENLAEAGAIIADHAVKVARQRAWRQIQDAVKKLDNLSDVQLDALHGILFPDGAEGPTS